MQYLVKLVTPPGGTVLDPFTGSGSTGKAAILEGFDFIGVELTEDYWPIIEGRLRHAEAKVAEAKENQEAQPQGLF
jgi:site-specific DNA-methyltransferase (adenine-specific)